MNKGIATVFFSIMLAPGMVKSQVVNESAIKIGKTPANGFVAISRNSKADLIDILKDQLGAEGLKKHGRKHKFTDYKGVVWHVTGANRVDLYYKVTGNKKRSKVYFIASKGYDNYITSATDQTNSAAITAYLGTLDAAVAKKEELKVKEAELNALNEKLESEKTAVKKTEAAKTQKAIEVKKYEKTEAY